MMSLTKSGKSYKVVRPSGIPASRKPAPKPIQKPVPKLSERKPLRKKTLKEKQEMAIIIDKEKMEKLKNEECGRIVVYTCVTGGYDNLIQPVKTDCIDYICFTDNLNVDPKGWQLRPMPEDVKLLSKVKQQRMVKVLAHKYLPEYDISVWVDGSVEVKGDVKEFMSSFIYSGFSIFIPEHPQRNCIYREAITVKAIGKDKSNMPEKQSEKYKAEGYPERNGLVQSNIMVRWHNNEDCIEVMEAWAKEIREFSHRDQLSFNYALWKTKATCFKYLDKKTCNSKYFKWNTKHNVKNLKLVKKK